MRATSWGRLCHPCLPLRTVQVLDVVLGCKVCFVVVVRARGELGFGFENRFQKKEYEQYIHGDSSLSIEGDVGKGRKAL